MKLHHWYFVPLQFTIRHMFPFVIIGAMAILTMWATVNAAYWWRSRNTAQGSRAYFWQMNALWSLVNVIAASVWIAMAMLHAQSYKSDTDLQNVLIRIFALHILANLAYIAVGLLLERRGKKNKNDRLDGYGQAIALQGAFLLCFDSTLTSALVVIVA